MALDDGRHPDAGRLAEYADGTLDPAARAEVERHLADCADCRAVVMEAMAFTETEPAVEGATAAAVIPFRQRKWLTGAAAGLAVAAALVFAVRVARPEWLFGPRSDRPELQELIAAVANEPTRPVEGRLSGGFKYAPPPPVTRGIGDRRVSPDVKIAAAKIADTYTNDPSPQNAAAAGVAYLQVGNVEQAVEMLERSVEQVPDRAEVWSDLSAAYLARHRDGDGARAVVAADHALRLAPGFREALFNRALANGSRLDSGAPRPSVWRDYLAVDPSSPWGAEARRRSGSGS